MTYTQWIKDFIKKRKIILNKLKNLTNEEIVDYFVFENMIENEPDFCLLYKEKKKCHDTEYLNCLFCACPYFKFDDDGIKKDKNLIVKSECTINSKHSSKFIYEGVEHLDCSTCKIPHTKKFASTFIKKIEVIKL